VTSPYPSSRLLPFQGTHNFRDAGGYHTSDGLRVRWGRLYRSDDLGRLTRSDREKLARLDLKLVVDLRMPFEYHTRADRLPRNFTGQVVHLPIHRAINHFLWRGTTQGRLILWLLSGQTRYLGTDNSFYKYYRSLALNFTKTYTQLFELLLDPSHSPAVIHCTEGKDRAGVAMAWIHLALGVPVESVFEDYLLTNDCISSQVAQRLRAIRWVSLFRTSPEQIRSMLVARREFLQATLDAAQEKYGSLDNYITRALGITPEIRARLREIYLEQ